MKIGVQEIPCRVCSAPSSGFHFGALTCEGCKGFFRRMVKEREAYSYKCSRNGNCEIKAMTRNMCKACRYNKCLQIGMSVKGSRIGRQPNAVKHALSLEARKQAALKVHPGNDNEGNTDSSPSEISFDSVIIDHCIPRDMEDCLQSIDLIQVSSSGDVFRQPLRKDEEVKPDMSLMHCQYDRMLNGEQNQDLFEGHVDHHSHIARHQMPTVSSGDNQMSSRDNHMPIVSSRDNHMPIVSSRGNHMPIVSSRDNSMPSVSFRDNHMPSVSSRDNHVPIVSSRDNHVPIVSSRDNHMPIASSRDNHTPIVSYRDNHTPIVSSRDNMSTVSSGHLHSGVQISYTSSLNQTSTSATIQRKFEPQIFGRPHIEVFDSSSDNQPQNLSIDLSKPRTLNTNDCGHNSSQNILPAADQFSLSSECSSTCVPPHGHTNLPSPSTGSPSSTYNYPIDYTHHVQQNDQCSYPIHNFVGQDEYYRPAYQHLERYEGSSPVFNMDSQIPNHNGEHSVLQMSQQEAFVSRMFTQSAEFQSLGGQFSSQFSRPDILPYIFPDQQQTSFPPRYRSEPFYNSEPIPSRQSSMDEAQPQSNGHTEESTHHVERGDTYKIHSDLRNFHTRSCPTAERQNFVGSQQMSNFHTNTSHIHAGTMPQPPCYPQLHSSLYDTESTVSQCSYKDQGLIQRSPQNNDNQEPPTSTPVNHDAGINNYLAMSNKELHGVLLDAAGNLANFCTVKRAKSDVFEEARFRDVDSTWEKMMEHFNFHARCIVRFAKRVPVVFPSFSGTHIEPLTENSFMCRFRSLKIDDQVLLLKMATYSLVILNHSRAYEPDTGFYNYFNFTKREIEMIRELFPEFDVIHIHYKHMGIMAQRDGLTEMEYAYLSCMLLFNDEYSGLENAERTKELKERYLEAFHNYEMEHFPSGSIRFGKMLQHMTEFSQFNMQHNIAVGLVITKNPQLHIPQLYAEMYTPDYPAEGKADSVNDNITDVVDKFVEPPAVVGTDK